LCLYKTENSHVFDDRSANVLNRFDRSFLNYEPR
jgi:hypothetical protein